MSSNTPQLDVKPSLPTELLPTDVARLFSLAHPALLLSVYYFRFGALVADPTSTLLVSLIPLSLIQALYTVICLPATGTNTKVVRKAKTSAKKGDLSARILVSHLPLLRFS